MDKAFNPFTFKVIIAIHVLLAFLLIVLYLFLHIFFLPVLFCSLLLWFDDYLLYCDFITFPSLCLYLLYIFGLWFPWDIDVVVYIYRYKIFLSCSSLNFKCIPNILHLYSPFLIIACFDIIPVCGWFLTFTVHLHLLMSFPICNFLVSSWGPFFFMPRVPLAFVVKLVWWCWILLAFPCL